MAGLFAATKQVIYHYAKDGAEEYEGAPERLVGQASVAAEDFHQRNRIQHEDDYYAAAYAACRGVIKEVGSTSSEEKRAKGQDCG